MKPLERRQSIGDGEAMHILLVIKTELLELPDVSEPFEEDNIFSVAVEDGSSLSDHRKEPIVKQVDRHDGVSTLHTLGLAELKT